MSITDASIDSMHRRVNRMLRVSAWADRWLIPFVMATLLLADAAIGAVWIIEPASALRSPVYAPAKQVMSMDAYGAVMLLTVLVVIVGFCLIGRSFIVGWLAGPLLGGQWFFWTVMFAAGAYNSHGTAPYVGAIFAAVLVVFHCLGGLAVSIPSPGRRPTRRATDPKR